MATTTVSLDYNRLYIPAILSVEGDVNSRLTLGVKCQVNFLLNGAWMTPNNTIYALGTVAYRF